MSWQTANHSVPTGRGIGQIGFKAAVPGTAGIALVSAGASSDPAFSTTLVVGGGTGLTSYTIGDLLYASGATALSALAAAASGKVLVSGGVGVAPAWSTATFPSTAGAVGTILRSDGTNWVATTATYPNTATSAGQLLRADGTNWSASTATFPNTTTVSQLLYSSSANTVAGLATANGGILNTGATGVPSVTPTPVLGVAGTTVGTIGFQNATSGTITLSPPTGALGTVTVFLPAANDTLVGKATTDELTNKTLTSSVGKGTWTASGTWTLPALTLGGTVSGGGNNINNVIIGAVTPLAGSFTTVTASSTILAGAGSTVGNTGRGGFQMAADGVMTLVDTAGTAFTRMQFGGTTSSFPSLKRSSAVLAGRLADDSADATLTFKTQSPGDNTTNGATTAFVTAAVAAATAGVASLGGLTGTVGLGTGLAAVAGNNIALSATTVTNTLGSDVVLNNTANYFDGPSCAQGTTGTWFASGSVVVLDSAGVAGVAVKLWDGTAVIDSSTTNTPGAGVSSVFALSGIISSPAANIRISVKDASSTNGLIKFNFSGNSKDSTLSVIRIA